MQTANKKDDDAAMAEARTLFNQLNKEERADVLRFFQRLLEDATDPSKNAKLPSSPAAADAARRTLAA